MSVTEKVHAITEIKLPKTAVSKNEASSRQVEVMSLYSLSKTEMQALAALFQAKYAIPRQQIFNRIALAEIGEVSQELKDEVLKRSGEKYEMGYITPFEALYFDLEKNKEKHKDLQPVVRLLFKFDNRRSLSTIEDMTKLEEIEATAQIARGFIVIPTYHTIEKALRRLTKDGIVEKRKNTKLYFISEGTRELLAPVFKPSI